MTTPSELLAQYNVRVEDNLNQTYELTGANVQFIGMVGIVVTVYNKAGLPAVGAPVVVNVFPDGHGDEPATPDGAGQVRFSAAANSAYTPPERGPFTVTLVDGAVKEPDTHLIHKGVPLSPSIQGMGDYQGNHTLWSLQFREVGPVIVPPDAPLINNDDELRNLALSQIYPQGIRFLNTAALVVYARSTKLGVQVTNEATFRDPVGRLHRWQGYVNGIVHTLDGHYAFADFTVTAW